MLRLTVGPFDQYDFSQLRWLSICKPRSFIFTDSFIYFSLYPILKSYCGVLFLLNYYICFSRFRASLFAVNQSLMWERTVFEIVQKSSTFLLEIITLLSFANIMGFHKLFIVGGRSFICIIKSLGPWIDPWGTPVFYCLPVWKKFFLSVVRWFYFSLLSSFR
jgi:hypothetical protein